MFLRKLSLFWDDWWWFIQVHRGSVWVFNYINNGNFSTFFPHCASFSFSVMCLCALWDKTTDYCVFGDNNGVPEAKKKRGNTRNRNFALATFYVQIQRKPNSYFLFLLALWLCSFYFKYCTLWQIGEDFFPLFACVSYLFPGVLTSQGHHNFL